MERQTTLYSKMSQAIRTDKFNNDFKAGEEFRLLEAAKDILDELRIMRDINSRQTTLLRDLYQLPISENSVQGRERFLKIKPQERKEVIKEMEKKADAAYKAIIHLIDLEQKQGNLFQAIASRDLLAATKVTLEQSEKSGKTLMVVSAFTCLSLLRVRPICSK